MVQKIAKIPKITNPENIPIVSFDIINHGVAPIETQLKRVSSLNQLVGKLIHKLGESKVIWVSGGDGGHVAIFMEDWGNIVTTLLIDLRKWAIAEAAQIRITCHYGNVISISGADGRPQLIGNGINFCGSLVNFGHNLGIVVSSAFKDAFVSVGACKVEFKDPRIVYLKHFVAETVFILSIPEHPELQGEWGGSHLPEERLLQGALRTEESNPWNVIYRTKRMMQLYSAHPKALSALEGMDHENLMYINIQDGKTRVNPLFQGMPKLLFLEILQHSELVEREDGDVLCVEGDEGDTMYVILNGRIGVSRMNTKTNGNNKKPFSIVLGAGSIVGELAFHLQSHRTATMQSIGRTALLALEPKRVTRQMRQSEVLRFLNSRALEHICNYAPHIGLPLKMSGRENPWVFLGDTSIQTFLWDVDHKVELTDKRFRSKGLYILASGRLYLDDGSGKPPDWSQMRSEQLQGAVLYDKQILKQEFQDPPLEVAGGTVGTSSVSAFPRVLEGKLFPILFVDIPQFIVGLPNRYFVDPKLGLVKVIHVPQKSLKGNFSMVFDNIVKAIKEALNVHFVYDVFISFNRNDKDFTIRLRDYFKEQNISVYMNKVEAGETFELEIQAALRQSRVMLAVLSANVKSAQGQKSWVEREIEYRQAIFDFESANILPLVLGDGQNTKFVSGISPIHVDNREEQAFKDALKFVREVKKQERSLPYSTRQCRDLGEI